MLTGFVTAVGIAAVALMMLHITVDVIGKYILNTPAPATISMVSHYYMVVVAFLPLAFAETRNAHITVEVLTELFPMRLQRHLYSWSYVLSALIYGLFTYRSWNEARTTHEIGAFIVEQGAKIVTWPSYYLLPIGAGLMTIVVLYRFLLYLTGAQSGLGEKPMLAQIETIAGTSATPSDGPGRG